MEVKDLRVGNYINLRNQLIKVTVGVLYDIENNPARTNYTPITLTEQWLLDFGFENKRMYGPDYFKLNNIIITKCNDDFVYFEVIGNVQIKFVHTLQNLYFALTNKELTKK